jgi:hypothetical protein
MFNWIICFDNFFTQNKHHLKIAEIKFIIIVNRWMFPISGNHSSILILVWNITTCHGLYSWIISLFIVQVLFILENEGKKLRYSKSRSEKHQQWQGFWTHLSNLHKISLRTDANFTNSMPTLQCGALDEPGFWLLEMGSTIFSKWHERSLPLQYFLTRPSPMQGSRSSFALLNLGQQAHGECPSQAPAMERNSNYNLARKY